METEIHVFVFEENLFAAWKFSEMLRSAAEY